MRDSKFDGDWARDEYRPGFGGYYAREVHAPGSAACGDTYGVDRRITSDRRVTSARRKIGKASE